MAKMKDDGSYKSTNRPSESTGTMKKKPSYFKHGMSSDPGVHGKLQTILKSLQKG